MLEIIKNKEKIERIEKNKCFYDIRKNIGYKWR